MPTPRRSFLLALFVSAFALAWGGTPASAKDSDLPEGVVAQVRGRNLTLRGFRIAVAQQQLHRLRDGRSGAFTVLRSVVEEAAVLQECKRLGITVSEADVDARQAQFDRDVRERSGATKTLRDLMREQNTSLAEMRHALEYQIRRQRIAAHPTNLGDSLPKEHGRQLVQIETVITELLKRTKLREGIPTAFAGEPETLDKGVIAVVQADATGRIPATPITMERFGRELILRLPSGDVREMLDRECKSALMSSEGLSLDDTAFDAEIAHQKALWTKQRMLASQTALANVSWEDYFEATQHLTVTEIRKKRYWRGYFALLRRMRAQVSAEDVRKAYEAGREGLYGERVIVTDIVIKFSAGSNTFGTQQRRKRDALSLARGIPRELARGIPFETLVKQINERKDASFRADRRQLRMVDKDRLLWNHASQLKDGDLSSPVQEIDSVHLLRREKLVPAPTFAEVEPVVREALTRERAREWLREQTNDPNVVKIRWPLSSVEER